MDRVKKLLEEQLSEGLIQIMISNPRNKTVSPGDCLTMPSVSGLCANSRAAGGYASAHKRQASKVKIRPVLLSGSLMFQASSFVGTQVFHENHTKQEMICEILSLMEHDFKQLALTSETVSATVLVSKKGTVTVKQRREKPAGGENRDKTDLSHNKEKQYILKENVPVPFLIDLGVQTKEGKIIRSKYDKFRQINRFLEFIEDVLPALPSGERVTILDFGCGKSYLTFAMYYFLKELRGYDIEIVGLDLKKDVIRNCNALAEKYGYDTLHFQEGDISRYEGKTRIDMVVTLHACDTATDYAIAKAIAWDAKVILSVPCCQHELNRQIRCQELAPVLKYGILKDRLSAIFTDAIRANLMEIYGYETQVMEFIDMSHTPKNVLLRGIKTNGMKKKGTSLVEIEEMLSRLHSTQTLMTLLQERKS